MACKIVKRKIKIQITKVANSDLDSGDWGFRIATPFHVRRTPQDCPAILGSERRMLRQLVHRQVAVEDPPGPGYVFVKVFGRARSSKGLEMNPRPWVS